METIKTKHTPGPWLVTDRATAPNKVIVHAQPRRIALCYLQGKAVYVDRAEAEANAKLIAAAPELLEAMIKVYTAKVETGKIGTEEVSMMIAVIKKATE